ncbi:protein IQ-DOMAIN 31-like isoform X2 [Durio zibethinus]|uniref:Protein IQ-DOMAIN 31-like isoform X2 n=1 Tax=Durio zibethinus TaxID=66656 RepID=A0A6P6AU53_DURZI|nr:protein IQ-DOMAIN 31-like isoform X2 [Durio zibethinus]
MGKSPGKWIKTVLFGKKSSKSSYPKGREKVANEREVLVPARASETDVVVAPPFSSQMNPYATKGDEKKLELENKETANISHDDGISLPMSQGIDSQESTRQDSPYDPERIKQEQAATMAQAAFRGYLARRAFRALKGIIRLQALIRGHLVRRQAISTLCCMMGIVKLQAHVRGLMVRHSDGGLEVQKKCNQINLLESKLVVFLGVNMPARIGKLSANVFVCKLVASSPAVMPVHLRYDIGEPNSVWNWLERWSVSCFWKPVPQPKKASDYKLQKKQFNGQAVEMDTGRPKRSVRRIRPANLDGTSVQATSEFDKTKRNLRKNSSHPAESVQENPQNELEKVKRNLRKVHNPVVDNSLRSEVEFEKPKQSLENASSTTNIDTLEQSLNSSAEKTNQEMAMTVDSSAEKMKKETAMTVNSSAEKIRKETVTVNSSAEKMKKEMALTINSSAEKIRKEAHTVFSSAERMKKETALTISSSAEKIRKETPTVFSSAERMKKETALIISSSADKIRKETPTVFSSAERMKKETALTINSSAEKMKKEAAMTVNSSAEKMRQEMTTVNSSAEKLKKETVLTINSSAEKMKKEAAMTVNSSAEKMRREMTTVNSSAEKLKKETALTLNSSAEKMKKEMATAVNGSAEKTEKQMTMAVSKSPDIETMPVQLGMNETSDLLHADPEAVDLKPSVDRTVKDENTPTKNVELNRKDDSVNNENQKSGRKASTTAKQDRTENEPQNSPALPSYMAATESAKAKLRLQGSSCSGQDGGDKNNLTRRQSLPSSANSKISSQSPRTQRLVHSGKAGSKSDRSMLSSRDGNAKATQVEWKR